MKNRKKARAAATAEQPARLVVELAGFRRRVASLVYESLLLMGVLALTFLVPYLTIGVLWERALPGWVLWVHVLTVLGAYFVWYWTRNGQTLAMQTWRLKLVREVDGRPPAVGLAVVRYLLCWPSVLCFGFGLMWALVDRDRQFLHDRLAGTRVVLLPDPRVMTA